METMRRNKYENDCVTSAGGAALVPPSCPGPAQVSFGVQTEPARIFPGGVYVSTSGGHHICDGGDACATSTHAPDGNGDRPSGKLPNAGASRSDGSIPAHSGSHAPGPLAPQLP